MHKIILTMTTLLATVARAAPFNSKNTAADEATRFSLIVSMPAYSIQITCSMLTGIYYGAPLLPFAVSTGGILSVTNAINKSYHARQLVDPTDQCMVRPNVDTLYL